MNHPKFHFYPKIWAQAELQNSLKSGKGEGKFPFSPGSKFPNPAWAGIWDVGQGFPKQGMLQTSQIFHRNETEGWDKGIIKIIKIIKKLK